VRSRAARSLGPSREEGQPAPPRDPLGLRAFSSSSFRRRGDGTAFSADTGSNPVWAFKFVRVEVWTCARHPVTVSACRASGGRTSWPGRVPGAGACTQGPRVGSASGELCRRRRRDRTRSARHARSTTAPRPKARPTPASGSRVG
jgi:hypothetical protein